MPKSSGSTSNTPHQIGGHSTICQSPPRTGQRCDSIFSFSHIFSHVFICFNQCCCGFCCTHVEFNFFSNNDHKCKCGMNMNKSMPFRRPQGHTPRRTRVERVNNRQSKTTPQPRYARASDPRAKPRHSESIVKTIQTQFGCVCVCR